MWRSVLALSFAVSAFTSVALGDSTCENPVEDGVESGECLLQSQLGNARQKGKYSDNLSEDGEEEDEEEPDKDPVDQERDEDPVGGEEESEDEGPDELEASELQYGYDDNVCGNWFGNNLDWNSVKATGKAEPVGGPTGTMVTYRKTNICSWDRTAGLQGVVGDQASPGPKTAANRGLSYRCKGFLNGKKQKNCKSTTQLGKNGGGVRVDCLNGMCADATNVKGDWSQSKPKFSCARFSTRDPQHYQLGGTYYLLSGNGKGMSSLWDPNCKVLCETMPECTGFSLKPAGKPFCIFFTGATFDTVDKFSLCKPNPKYDTYFLKRK